MDPAAWKLLAVIAIAVVVVVVPPMVVSDYRQKKFARLLQSLGGESVGIYAGKVESHGQTYALNYSFGSRSEKSDFTISVARPSPKALTVRKETVADHVLKRIGLNREMQLEYPDFDAAVYFEGEDHEFATLLFNQPDSRQAAKGILEHFSAIEFGPGGCVVRKSPCSKVTFLTKSVLTETLGNFAALIARIPAVPASTSVHKTISDGWPGADRNAQTAGSPGNRVAGRPRPRTGLRAEVIASGGVFGVGLILFLTAKKWFPPVDPWGVFYPAALAAGLPLCLGLSVVVLRLVKGHSDSSKRLFGYMALIISGSLMAAMGAIEIGNASLDTSAAVQHECVVRSKYITTSKRTGVRYQVYVDSWQRQGERYDFNVSRAEYDSVVPDKTSYLITTKKGVFGYEWIKRIVKVQLP